MSKINNPKLYEQAKREVYNIYKTPSAYRSGMLVKRYKELGGTYSGTKKTNEGLTRWFKEEWSDIGNKDYPVYRPTIRVSKDTPLLKSEIDKKNLEQQIKIKQIIKNKKNLKPFKKK